MPTMLVPWTFWAFVITVTLAIPIDDTHYERSRVEPTIPYYSRQQYYRYINNEPQFPYPDNLLKYLFPRDFAVYKEYCAMCKSSIAHVKNQPIYGDLIGQMPPCCHNMPNYGLNSCSQPEFQTYFLHGYCSQASCNTQQCCHAQQCCHPQQCCESCCSQPCHTFCRERPPCDATVKPVTCTTELPSATDSASTKITTTIDATTSPVTTPPITTTTKRAIVTTRSTTIKTNPTTTTTIPTTTTTRPTTTKTTPTTTTTRPTTTKTTPTTTTTRPTTTKTTPTTTTTSPTTTKTTPTPTTRITTTKTSPITTQRPTRFATTARATTSTTPPRPTVTTPPPNNTTEPPPSHTTKTTLGPLCTTQKPSPCECSCSPAPCYCYKMPCPSPCKLRIYWYMDASCGLDCYCDSYRYQSYHRECT